jgi:DNA-binding MarR family transcriptional regulator
MDRDDFGVLLSLASLTFVENLNEALAKYPRFSGAWTGFVLRALDEETMSLRQLAERLQMSSPGALKIVEPMVRDGYLRRVSDPNDKRVRAVAIAPKGRRALADARAFHAQFEADLIERLGPKKVAAAREVLEAILENASTHVPQLFRPRRVAVER